MTRATWGLALLLALHLPAAAAAGASTTVEVMGLVDRPTTFTVADLQGMERHEVVVKGDGTTSRTYRGVLLRDLLAACKPSETGRFDLRRSYYVARASDDYLAVFSWAELFNGANGDAVLVAYERDGVALDEAEGRIALVAGRDTRSGPRHVRWLTSIDVRRAAP